MLIKETSFERFNFTCTGCDHAWASDYDVQHVEDGHGHERDYFFRAQLHCPDPTGPGETTCPRCGRVSILAWRSAPPTDQSVANKAPESHVELPAPLATAQAPDPLLTAVPELPQPLIQSAGGQQRTIARGFVDVYEPEVLLPQLSLGQSGR